jgi:nitrate reductase delta subunit
MASRLLDFPGDDLLSQVKLLKGAAESTSERWGTVVLDFLAYLGKTSLLAVQEEYTRTFDLNPSLCLNLTFHKWGEEKKRSTALVEFKKMYRDAGFEVLGGDLPDYLPIVLEFLAVSPEESCLPIYDEYGDQVALIASRLREMQSPYAGIADALDSAWRR